MKHSSDEIIPVVSAPLSAAQRDRVHDEVRLVAEISAAADRHDVETLLRLAGSLSRLHYGPHS